MWEMIGVGSWLAAMGIYDIRYKRVPLWLIGLGIPIVLGAGIAEGRFSGRGCAEWLFCILPGIVLLIAALMQRAGYGDGLVLLLLGVAEGGDTVTNLFLLSLILMSLFVVGRLIRHRAGKNTRYPYIPFLLAAWVILEVLL